jgi:hypothetical protein
MATKTIHFAAFRKNGTEEQWRVPYCRRRDHYPKFGAITENKEEVTCTRCAKQLDITPAKKVDTSKNMDKTCACCFSVQKAKASTGTMFHHGFTRTGYGYIVGPCIGHDFPSYELSCAGTKYMLTLAQAALLRTQQQIQHLETTDILSKDVNIEAIEYIMYRGWQYKQGTIILKKGEPDVEVVITSNNSEWFLPRWSLYAKKHTYNFENERKALLANARSQERQIQSDIEFFTKKIEEWKLVG